MKGIDVAEKFIGKQERRDKKELMAFMASEGVKIDPSTTPWCAAFIDACEKKVGNRGTSALNARSFLKYGNKVEPKDAEVGDIVIFTRGSSTWQGHVSYFVEWNDDSDTVIVLGGNQSDMVCYSHYACDRIIGIRRP